MLKEDPANFAVDIADVKSARIVDHSDEKQDIRLTIATTTKGTLTLMMPYGDIAAARDTLRRTLGSKFR